MRYIKEYNEYSCIKLIAYDEYAEVLTYDNNIAFSKREVEELISIISIQSEGGRYSFSYGDNGEIVGVSYKYILSMINMDGFIHYNSRSNIDVYIDKFEDDWFYVKLVFGIIDSRHYKCDQFDSLLSWLVGLIYNVL
jgi:hypothetical protein